MRFNYPWYFDSSSMYVSLIVNSLDSIAETNQYLVMTVLKETTGAFDADQTHD